MTRRNVCTVVFAAVLTAPSIPGDLFAAGGDESRENAEPLRIAYSDWPGWVAWQVGIEKGFFEAAGVEVDFQWFEYVPSMDAFAAGQVDAVAVTNGDALVNAAAGAPGTMILLNDYSNGNDMVVAAPGISSIGDLEGKTVGLEVGFVAHLLFLNALEGAGVPEDSVEIVNVPTHQTPEVLASGDVDAVAAWQPNSGAALKALAGSRALFTSADVPGLIYDTLTVNPSSLAMRRDDWKRVVAVWYEIVDYIKDPANRSEVLEIMSARVNLSPEEYAGFLEGTYLLTFDEAMERIGSEPGFGSLYGSTVIADDFNVTYGAYPENLEIDRFIDTSLMIEVYEGG